MKQKLALHFKIRFSFGGSHISSITFLHSPFVLHKSLNKLKKKSYSSINICLSFKDNSFSTFQNIIETLEIHICFCYIFCVTICFIYSPVFQSKQKRFFFDLKYIPVMFQVSSLRVDPNVNFKVYFAFQKMMYMYEGHLNS